jgi:hypothetical protein
MSAMSSKTQRVGQKDQKIRKEEIGVFRTPYLLIFPIFLSQSSALLPGCSSPPPKVAPVVAPPPPPPPHRAMGVSSELGQIDEAATIKTFDRVRPALMKCYTTGLDRLEYLAGDVKFFMRVKADGHVHWVFMQQSSIGDRATEKCMLDVLTATQWPLPEGGEAEVHQGLGFDAPQGVRPPTSWSTDRVAAALGKHAKDFAACKGGESGSFNVTAYVAKKGAAGRVLAAGGAASTTLAADKIDCLLDVVTAMKLPSPGSYPAKVSFSL